VKGEIFAPAVEIRHPAQTTGSKSVECGTAAGDAYADPGYRLDGKRRYPIDAQRHVRAAWDRINNPGNSRKYTAGQFQKIKAEIIAAWKKKIAEDGPPSADHCEAAARDAFTRALSDVARTARVIIDLDWLREALNLQAAIENDNSPLSARIQEIITELCEFLNEFVTEETSEILSGAEADTVPIAPAIPGMLAMASGEPGVARIAALFENGKPSVRKLAAGLLAKAKHSQSDQALLDMAHLACDKCLNIVGLSVDERANMGTARDHLLNAGALPVEDRPYEITDEDFEPAPEGPQGESAGVQTIKVLGVIAAVLAKAGRAQQHMMDVAHGCLRELTDGTICAEAAKAGARHSAETMEHLNAAHRHLVAAGAACDNSSTAGSDALIDDGQRVAGCALGKDVRTEDLAKALAGERAEKAALVKVLDEIVPMLNQLTKRVDGIARTPLPPLTIAKGTISVSKQQDRGSASGGDPALSPEMIASALGKMSKEEQTLTLIKASYANPIRVLGSAISER
jgi:hypothetical protein